MLEADGTFFNASIVTQDEKYEPDNPSYMFLRHKVRTWDGISVVKSNKFNQKTPYTEYIKFSYGTTRVLVTTDILSRAYSNFGFKHLNHIVNFYLPVNQFCEADFETYLHRIGRTGRFG